MGEIALRRIQAGLETTRGVAVPATRNIYGKQMVITRAQPRRFVEEQRGVWTKYFRSNPKLIEATFKLDADLTFEDLPYFLETTFQGGVTPTGAAGTGYTWAYAPDMSSDLIRTRTYYAGDDAVQWQGRFGISDKLAIDLSLNDGVKLAVDGYVADWVPVTSAFLTTAYAAPGFASIPDRAVESIMGYQSKLFIDNPGSIGTTQRVGRFISAKTGIALDVKRKFFGDNVAYLQKAGRGLRASECEFVFEGMDQSEFADHYNNIEKAVRIALYGTAIAGTSFGTTNGALAAGTPVTSIVTNALTAAIPGGVGINVGGVTFTVAPAGAASAALAIPVISQTPQVTIPTGATIMAAKTINIDMYGNWDAFGIGERETNTTFAMKLVNIYDATQAMEHKITVVNGLAAAAGVS